MREIIFRGKRVDNGEWVYGDLRNVKSCYISQSKQVLIPVNENTIGQFTGLLDKNGNKVFEGDFVKRIYRYEVKYKSGRFYLHNDGDRFHLRIDDFGSDFKIIGNIHESLTPNK